MESHHAASTQLEGISDCRLGFHPLPCTLWLRPTLHNASWPVSSGSPEFSSHLALSVDGLASSYLIPSAQFSGADPQLPGTLESWWHLYPKHQAANLSQPWVSYTSTNQRWLCSWKFCSALRNETQEPARPAPRDRGETDHEKWL